MLAWTRSIEVDMRLLPHDIEATKAHGRVLVAAGLLQEVELAGINAACDAILAEWEAERLEPGPLDEDVHSVVEREITARLGDVGARIHAGRSRNDLVAQDLRLWCKQAAERLLSATSDLVAVLAQRAEEHVDTLMPGYTHLQRAQPISVGFYLCAHGAALARDRERFAAARDAADVCVLGAGALAGTTLPLQAEVAREQLDASGLFLNAMDAVSDRDFASDLLHACALCGVHLSRLAEEIVIFSSSEFGFMQLPDAWSTGSSMMPQKRNPDLAELIRGRSASGIGDLTSLLTLLKGLPLAYDRDLQEDKEIVFRSVDRTQGCIEAMTCLIEVVGFDTARLTQAAGQGAMWATDVAEGFVREGMPFRQAHERAGKLVAAVESGSADPATAAPVSQDPAASMSARRSHGGTAPERVREQIAALRNQVTG
jgi:argininosuccinate lyase